MNNHLFYLLPTVQAVHLRLKDGGRLVVVRRIGVGRRQRNAGRALQLL